ncbi:DEKNAAC100050 [Brettanomyces naardenensis]|uniref:DEKNAAC100050 n=1 Tax=Brettanomyces naardenensis TaxID=13370 RepID=A0A448YF26_BRENA|nr:DEKNAAC100050 [Brettanomyces naardenensis]
MSSRFIGLSKEELLEKMAQFESEFVAYQEESKELEDFLETELDSTTKKLKEMEVLLMKREDEGKTLRARIVGMNKELHLLRESRSLKVNEKDTKIEELSKNVVNLEVINDAVQSNLRAKASQLSNAIERSNGYIERIAVLENDYALQTEELETSNKRNVELQRQLERQAQERRLLEGKIRRMEKILKLATVNREDLRVSKFQTPPVK